MRLDAWPSSARWRQAIELVVLATLGAAIASEIADLEMSWTSLLMFYAIGHLASRWVSLGRVAIGLSAVAGSASLCFVQLARDPVNYGLSFLTVLGLLVSLSVLVLFSVAAMLGATIGRSFGR